MSLVSLKQFQITRSNSTNTETIVAESLQKAAEAATDSPSPLHTIRTIAEGIMVDKPLRTVEFFTSVLPEEAKIAGCKAYPTNFVKEEEQTCIFEAVPAEGYQFVSWTKDGEEISREALVELAITPPSSASAYRSEYIANFMPA